jgi:predicted TIM-barrel enzyme
LSWRRSSWSRRASAEDARRHLLLVATCAVEEPKAVAEISRAARLGPDAGDVDVLVLAPARIGFLDRWASDVESARHAAQENLVATVAALAKAGVKAEARVGDEDIVQAVEDQLQTFPATEVVLVSGRAAASDEEASAELGKRLEADFGQVILDD